MDDEDLNRIPRSLYQSLEKPDPWDVRRELGPYLDRGEMQGLLVRRDLLLRHFDKLAEERGEEAVFF